MDRKIEEHVGRGSVKDTMLNLFYRELSGEMFCLEDRLSMAYAFLSDFLILTISHKEGKQYGAYLEPGILSGISSDALGYASQYKSCDMSLLLSVLDRCQSGYTCKFSDWMFFLQFSTDVAALSQIDLYKKNGINYLSPAFIYGDKEAVRQLCRSDASYEAAIQYGKHMGLCQSEYGIYSDFFCDCMVYIYDVLRKIHTIHPYDNLLLDTANKTEVIAGLASLKEKLPESLRRRVQIRLQTDTDDETVTFDEGDEPELCSRVLS